MTTEYSLLDMYENTFGDEIDKESDAWKTFRCIMTIRPAFYNLMMNEVMLGNKNTDNFDTEFVDSLHHLAWILWEGSNPDGSALGDALLSTKRYGLEPNQTAWGDLANMFIQMKGLEIKHG